jgi:aminoglycoside 2''-phosphotransferase
MKIPDDYIEKIRAVYPNSSLERVEFNQDGMNNDVIIIDQQLVCRFPKTKWAKQTLAIEVKILQLVQSFIDLPIPQIELVEEDFVSYPFIGGEALSRNKLLRLESSAQEKVIAQLGEFYQQLHSIPNDVLETSGIAASVAERTREDMLHLYQKTQEILFPYLWKHQRTWVHEHFEPLVEGNLTLEASPVLIHGDLGCYHILFNSEQQRISGIIDFGTAGLGNPAIDFASLLDNYGEPVVKRMAPYYSDLESLIDQARFRAGTVWLQWALMGVQQQDTELLLAHIGSSARDIQPLGVPW